MPTPFDELITDVMAYKTALAAGTQKQKEKHVSIPTARQFNALLDRIKRETPDLAPKLPEEITWVSDSHLAGLSDIIFLELEISVERVFGLLNLYKSHR
jgi:hypothetical protein